MKTLKHDVNLAKKYKIWKVFCARPYSRYGNARRNNREMNREKKQALKKGGPLKTAISDLIPENIKLKLNKIK